MYSIQAHGRSTHTYFKVPPRTTIHFTACASSIVDTSLNTLPMTRVGIETMKKAGVLATYNAGQACDDLHLSFNNHPGQKIPLGVFSIDHLESLPPALVTRRLTRDAAPGAAADFIRHHSLRVTHKSTIFQWLQRRKFMTRLSHLVRLLGPGEYLINACRPAGPPQLVMLPMSSFGRRGFITENLYPMHTRAVVMNRSHRHRTFPATHKPRASITEHQLALANPLIRKPRTLRAFLTQHGAHMESHRAGRMGLLKKTDPEVHKALEQQAKLAKSFRSKFGAVLDAHTQLL